MARWLINCLDPTHTEAYDSGACKECQKQQALSWAHTNPERKRKNTRRHKLREYGLTETDFNRMLTEQDSCCKICKMIPNDTLHIDHCHKTGKVRGLLCASCNIGIGHLQEDTAILRRAILYLMEKRNEVR